MKRINLLYLVVIILIATLMLINQRFNKQTLMFYGFAENKETEINLDHAIEVKKILVTPGQEVSKNTPLVEVVRSSLNLQTGTVEHQIAELEAKEEIRIAEIKASIRNLEAKKIVLQGEILSKINELKAKSAFNDSLIKELKSIPHKDTGDKTYNPTEIKIQNLEKELELSSKPLDAQIKKLRDEIKISNNPIKIRIKKLRDEQNYLEGEKEKLTINAPNDGVIGTIHCKVGENLSSFAPIINFYQQKPTQVKGFILEDLILKVAFGDSVIISSTLHPERNAKGVVTGLGSRIVEIPERLRKIPKYKTYGREVIISISNDNDFLQKEKVMINLLPDDAQVENDFLGNIFGLSPKKLANQ